MPPAVLKRKQSTDDLSERENSFCSGKQVGSAIDPKVSRCLELGQVSAQIRWRWRPFPGIGWPGMMIWES
jgi:hypothetical protein